MLSSTLAVALLLGSVSVLFHPIAAKAPACDAGDEACPAGASGRAMLQTGIDKRASGRASSLEGRIATLDAELTSLDNRVAIMMSAVGLPGGAAFVAKSDSYDRYRALLKHTYADADLITVVGDLEAKADSVKNHIVSVEDEVSGAQIRNSGSLLEEKNGIQMRAFGDSLTNRVTALEEVVSSLKDRAIAMEEKITGMGSKA